MAGFHPRCWLLLALLFAAAAPLHAQEPAAVRRIVLPSLDSQVAARMIALDSRLNPTHSANLAAGLLGQLMSPAAPLGVFTPLLADARNREVWAQLPDEYYRMTQESGDALIALPEMEPNLGVGWSSGQVRRLCHQRLAALPRASLELYRQRVDAEARALLEQGRKSRSPIPLRRLVDELFCSTPGDLALDLLGDLAFERGDFDEARHSWSLLAPPAGAGKDRLVFPHPKVDLVRVQAKQVLAMIFQGRLDESQREIARFIQAHPDAKGPLAGQNDRFGVILHKTLQTFAKERISNNDEPWTTFGGDPARNRTLSQGLSWQLWEDGPAWSVKLPTLSPNGKDAAPNRYSLRRRVAFHPVIVNQQVLIADHRSVVSYQLTTGKELFRYDLKTAGLHDPGIGIETKTLLPRFTLSADNERAYVRLGRLKMMPKKIAEDADASYLVCLDLTQPEKAKKRELWHIEAQLAIGDDKSPALFEGSPLVHDGRVYIALSNIVGRRVLTSIVCYDMLGRKRWAREVCDCPEFETAGNGSRGRQHLLTLAGGQIVYCSHAGAIVAVDAWTGQPAWGMRYPSRGPLTPEYEPSPRDLTPALYADGRVYAAPLDSDRLFCLDAVTGRLHWEVEGIEIVHLLGVAHGRLFTATRKGLMSIETANGQTDWTQPTEGRLPSLGRGLLAGSWLIWPTQDEKLPYRAVTLRAGGQQKEGDAESVLPEPSSFDPTMLHTLPVGNLAFGNGCLVVAGLSELVVFAPAHKLHQLPPPVVRPHARIEAVYQQARRQASSGQTAAAAQTYAALLEATKSHPLASDWRALIEARLGRQRPETPVVEPTLDRAERALKAERYGEAADSYRRLMAGDQTVGEKARCALGLARAYEGQRDYRSAWHTWTWFNTPLGDLIDPVSKKPFSALMPSAKKEPYVSALVAGVPAGPGLPLVRAWSQADGKVWPTDTDDWRDDFFFCTQPGQVTCRSLDDGALRWKAKLDFEPAWFGRWHDVVLISGRDKALALRVHDGQPTWSFAAPSRLWRLGSVRDGVPTTVSAADGFVHAERWGETLLLLDDHRYFYRLRLDTGEVAWQYAAPSAALRPLDAASFGRFVTPIGDRLWVQSINGQPYWLGVKPTLTGLPWRPWVQPPLVIGNRIVLAGEQGRVFGNENKPPHARVWTYQAPWPTSLTGDLCRLMAKDGVLLALVPRNAGYDCVRLDPERGTRLWTARLPADLDVSSLCIGHTSFYCLHDGKLHARSLNNGTQQWSQALPGRWQLRYTKEYLAVHPTGLTPDADFCVGFIDLWDGRWLQRLTFPGVRVPDDVLLTPNHVLVAVGGQIFGFRSLPDE